VALTCWIGGRLEASAGPGISRHWAEPKTNVRFRFGIGAGWMVEPHSMGPSSYPKLD